MVDIGLGGFHERRTARDERKLVRFPDVTDGRVADAITLLTRPGTARELRSEAQFRRLYRASAVSWPLPRQGRNRISVLVGVASIASVFATATGLSAASVLPSPAAHVVNSVLGPLNRDGGSPTTPPASATQPSAPAAPATAPSVTSLVAGSGATAGTTGGTDTACHHGRAPCTVHHAHSLKTGGKTVSTTGGANQSVGSNAGTTSTAGGTTPVAPSTSSTPPVSTATSGTGGKGGSGGNGGSTGSTGSGSGSTPGTGANRGGNQGAGSGRPARRHGGGHHGGRTGSTTPPGSGKAAGSRGHRHSGAPTDPWSSTTVPTAPESTPDTTTA